MNNNRQTNYDEIHEDDNVFNLSSACALIIDVTLIVQYTNTVLQPFQWKLIIPLNAAINYSYFYSLYHIISGIHVHIVSINSHIINPDGDD